MADEVKPADSAQAPAGTQAVTPAATAATATDTSQVELQRTRTELGIERKRREDAQKLITRQAEMLKRYEGGQVETEAPTGIGGFSPEMIAATVHRSAFMNVVMENMNDPTAVALLPEVQKMFADPDVVARYQRPDPADSYREALRDLKMSALEGQLAETRKQLEARNNGRDVLKAQAVVSGVSASQTEAEMTLEDFRKLPLNEQKEALKKMGMYRA